LLHQFRFISNRQDKNNHERSLYKNYFKPQKPFVLERFIENWPAYSKWNLNFIKEVVGDKVVPLYDDRPVDFKEGFNEPQAKIKMRDYVDLL
jgi:hypothetical protein